MLNFESEYEEFIKKHLKSRKGERARRLMDGHGHAEMMFLQKVWWPAFRQFEYLHPEYEVHDFKDGTRFIDFAFIRHGLRLAIEIDGYGPHASQISRTQFSDQWVRQNHLIIDGWWILRFSYDDVKDQPRKCQQMLQQFMGRWFSSKDGIRQAVNFLEKEVLRVTMDLTRPLTLQDVCNLLQVKHDKSRKILHEMVRKQLLISAKTGKLRIRYYQIHPLALDPWRMH